MPASVSVVIPMYNEEDYVERTLAAVRGALERAGLEHEMVLVDDASTDRTAALADAAASADARVRVIHNPRNLTLGGSLRAGFAAATKDLVLYTDADLPFDLEEVGRAVRLLEVQQADLLSRVPVRPHLGRPAPRPLHLGLQRADPRRCSGCASATSTSRSSCSADRCWSASRCAARAASSTRSWSCARPRARRIGDPDRRRLLPPHPWRVETLVGARDRAHPA